MISWPGNSALKFISQGPIAMRTISDVRHKEARHVQTGNFVKAKVAPYQKTVAHD
jgi:hypothetical protein